MNLQELRNAGAFCSAEPEQVQVEWKGYTFDIHVKRLGFGYVEKLMKSENPSITMLAAAVLMGEDKEPLTYEDAERLDTSLAVKLIEAVNKVNSPGN